MRLPCVRFKMRSKMAAVVALSTLVATAWGIYWLRNPERIRIRRLTSTYIAQTEHHAELERKFALLSQQMDFFKGHGTKIIDGDISHFAFKQRPELVPRYLELARFHASLREKYEKAASNPKFPVAPDPPEPPVPE